jgi:hypothetical protein
VKLLAEMLAQIQAQQLELDTLQAVNGAKPSDPAANCPPDREGNRPTYAEKRRQLKDGEDRFYELHAKHLPEIRAFLAGIQAAQEG